MKTVPTSIARIAALLWLFLAACEGDVRTDQPIAERDTVRDTVPAAPAVATGFLDATDAPVTLPVLDAFFQDSTFVATLRDSLSITDEQVLELRKAAREEASRLDGDLVEADTSVTAGTRSAQQRALERISGIIGPEKTDHLARIVRALWRGSVPEGVSMAASAGAVPTDTRIVINAPSFRMDLFENGALVRSYSIASGYPEFPLPMGLRQADQIIFNPPWTPPDEPWVEASGKVKVGQRVAPGSKLNPLGMMKIPIGLPSLIHGGKSAKQIGGFGSHGCAGLTDDQAKEFARLLAEVSGTSLTDKEIAEYRKDKKQAHPVKLATPVPVELRYETIVAEDGAVRFYADVYDRGTTTEAGLRAALATYDVTLESVTEPERTALLSALETMGGSASDSAYAARAADTSSPTPAADSSKRPGKLTRSVKGPKELTVVIAALAGKGYPKEMKTALRATN